MADPAEAAAHQGTIKELSAIIPAVAHRAGRRIPPEACPERLPHPLFVVKIL